MTKTGIVTIPPSPIEAAKKDAKLEQRMINRLSLSKFKSHQVKQNAAVELDLKVQINPCPVQVDK